MRMFTISLVAFLLLPVGAQAQTIAATAAANPDFSTLITLVASVNLVDVLNDPEAELTVFAPVNAAFEALPEAALAALAADPALLTRVLTYHVIAGRVGSADLAAESAFDTMEMETAGAEPVGSQLTLTPIEGGMRVNGAAVVTADIEASNGVIHAIDTVLLPPDIAGMFGLDAPDVAVFGTLNAGGLENDLVYASDPQFSAEALAPLGAIADIVNVQSVAFDSTGNAFVTVDLAMNDENQITAGGIMRFDGAAESRALEDGVLIAGENTGIVSPKGLQVLETLGVVAIADNGAKDVKLFALDAEGDAAPVATIAVGGESGVWDVWYDILNDTLYAAQTNGDLAAYDTFSETLGADGPDRLITPTDDDGNKISVNLHGIDVDYDSNTVIVSDIGDPDSNADGQIFLLYAVSISDGPTPVDVRIAGDQTMLGNPVDLIFDSAGIYVAEKANDKVLYFANIMDLSGDLNIAPDIAADAVKAESVAVYPTRESKMIEDMGLLDGE